MINDNNNQDSPRGHSFYCWDAGGPQNSRDVIRLAGDHECFVTGEFIKPEDEAYWTDEFDAWISVRGHQMINNAHSNGELANNREWEIIFAEWYAKDESVAGLQEEAEYHNEQFRRSH
tara:strand:- start:648 stop:1001 length:354 start_codon:yes stop_codon:yes gene_type:complete